LRVALAPDRLRAVADAIERGTPIEIAARVLDLAAPDKAALEVGGTVLLELHVDASPDGSVRSGTPGREAVIEPLTPREREVLELVAEGMSNRAIAERLAISEHTVKFHVNTIYRKLGVSTRTEAVVHGARLGLLAL